MMLQYKQQFTNFVLAIPSNWQIMIQNINFYIILQCWRNLYLLRTLGAYSYPQSEFFHDKIFYFNLKTMFAYQLKSENIFSYARRFATTFLIFAALHLPLKQFANFVRIECLNITAGFFIVYICYNIAQSNLLI